MDYKLNNNEKIAVLEMFKKLNISPTIDKDKIKYAFKKKAVIYHPDKAINNEKKLEYENKFKELVNIRDICLEVSEINSLLEQLSSVEIININDYENSNNKINFKDSSYQNQTKKSYDFYDKEESSENLNNSQVEDEWKQFVKDQNAYFNAIDASITSLSTTLYLTVFSIFFSISLSIIIGLIITGLVAIFSASFAIPIVGWIGGIVFLLWLIGKTDELYKKMANYTLESLSTTGHPYTVFKYGWLTQNIIIGFISILLTGFWWTLLILFFTNLGYYLIYATLEEQLIRIQESLDKIRNNMNRDVILSRAKSRFSS